MSLKTFSVADASALADQDEIAPGVAEEEWVQATKF
jgi:hypothetical protein